MHGRISIQGEVIQRWHIASSGPTEDDRSTRTALLTGERIVGRKPFGVFMLLCCCFGLRAVKLLFRTPCEEISVECKVRFFILVSQNSC